MGEQGVGERGRKKLPHSRKVFDSTMENGSKGNKTRRKTQRGAKEMFGRERERETEWERGSRTTNGQQKQTKK